MPNLKNLDTKELSKIINVFNGKIFQSEAQFQFDLAWKLKEKIYNCAVVLEDMCAGIKNGNGGFKKKFYTDIVLEQDGYRIAIELKYKTAEYNGLLNHGAADLGRYDYLWDVHRIELLTGKGNNQEKDGYVDVLKSCNKGFAVLLTNEKKYWEQNYDDPKVTMDFQFKMGEGKNNLCEKVLDWKKDDNGVYPKTVDGTSRAQPIILYNAYNYQWEIYCHDTKQKNGEFRFVIIEVR